MEHSYSKDVHPKGNVEVMATRSILIPRPPQCPSCYQHTTNDDILAKMENHQSDPYFDQLPPAINDNIAKMAMEETERLTKNVKNTNADDDDWDLKVNKIGWSKQQLQLYRQVSSILDYDQLSRLAVSGRPNEGIIRRCSIDKSVARMRLVLASVHWNTDLTQWLNLIMFTYLPPTYMASYLDILQSLRVKVPTLVDKMLAGRPASFNQDYLQAITKRPWGANVPTKSRKLPGQSPIIVIIPATLNSTTQQPSPRMKRWFSLLGTMASTAPIQHPVRPSQSLESITEQLIAITRSKIQDLRNEMPNRHIILVGINTGAAIALQVALVENVSSIVCMGFAYNTVKGQRGAPDDKILEITTPVLFILGENSARSSQEEIESLREKMSAQTSLVVVGSADDALRINKFNRHLEGVTQSMVDNMIADEIQDFVSTCIINPPGPRKIINHLLKRSIGTSSTKKHDSTKKRKHKINNKADKGPPRKVGRPRLIRANEIPSEKPKSSQALLKQSNENLKMNVQNIVPTNEVPTILNNEVVTVATSSEPSTNKTIATAPNAIASPILDNGINLNVSNTQEVTTSENSQSTDVKISLASVVLPTSTVSTITPSTPPKVIQPTIQPVGQFVQVKPPTTTSGRVQSPNVKNFFIRKGIEKQPQNQIVTSSAGTYITSAVTSPQMSINPLPSNKKIIIKSQQIIVPAHNAKPNPSAQIIQVSGQSQALQTNLPTSHVSIPINANVLETSASSSGDLSGILDLPILFADNNDTPVIDQTAQILNTSSGSSSNILLNTSTDRTASMSSPQNIFITTADGKSVIPNRPLVITTAKVSKPTLQSTVATAPSTNKVIFINRGLKQQIVGSQSMPIGVKGLQTLKLVPTSMGTSTQSTSITLQGNQITKLPGNKINLSTLKLVKNPSNVTGNIVKPLILNKAVSGANNIVIKSPMGGNVKTHPAVIKANVLNRNITVKKVMNVIPGVKPISSPPPISTITSSPVTISSVATSPIVTLPIASSPIASSPIASSPITSSPIASSPIATSSIAAVSSINSSPTAQSNTGTVSFVHTSLVVTPSTSTTKTTTRKTRSSS
ncbi:KAT8 regulatory NSL complex subunit 3-like [Contarinia nasturtii]|uniref:KAT8 regulatory NSL complex subunit 3-like n=1 Tax=Contarinia nasturtii TaxID=265458 RepID=UPI0012D45166|nr:KAT8 regulatory NSL complex subunit 3-like [Contarinia nasturtii]